jgi:hypothetical protein
LDDDEEVDLREKKRRRVNGSWLDVELFKRRCCAWMDPMCFMCLNPVGDPMSSFLNTLGFSLFAKGETKQD